MSRELDVIELCKKVIDISPECYSSLNSSDESICPFCYNREYDLTSEMTDIVHETGCAYLLAKDLLTNID